MERNRLFLVLFFSLLLLAVVSQVLYFIGPQSITVNGLSITTNVLAGVFTGSAIGAVGYFQYQKGRQRNAVGVVLWAIGVSLILLDLHPYAVRLSLIFMLTGVGVLYKIDRRILAKAG